MPLNINISNPQTESLEYMQRWHLVFRTMGATDEQISTYQESAMRYAKGLPYSQQEVVDLAFSLARTRLMRGEPMPTDAAHEIDQAWQRVAEWCMTSLIPIVDEISRVFTQVQESSSGSHRGSHRAVSD